MQISLLKEFKIQRKNTLFLRAQASGRKFQVKNLYFISTWISLRLYKAFLVFETDHFREVLIDHQQLRKTCQISPTPLTDTHIQKFPKNKLNPDWFENSVWIFFERKNILLSPNKSNEHANEAFLRWKVASRKS